MSTSSEIYIRKFDGTVLGKIITKDNGDKEARDFYGRIVAKYDSRYDVTRDFYGRIIAKGEALSMALRD